jgi:6-methylsalicylate decarboxylase
MLEDSGAFYYETALTGFEPSLAAIENFVALDHILFGSVVPAVNFETAALCAGDAALALSPRLRR